MSGIDSGIVGLYLLAVLAIGLYLRRRAARDVDSYFLGSKRLRWYTLCLSDASGMFDISGTMWLVTLMFVYGMKSIWLPWLWPVFNQIFLMAFLAVWLRRSGVRSGAEWITFRFGEGAGARLSHLSVVLFALIAVIGFLTYGFVGIGKFMELFLPWEEVRPLLGVDLPEPFVPYAYGIAFTLIATTYAVLGGMIGIVWADVLQFAIMTISAVIIAILAMTLVNPAQLAAATPAGWGDPFFGWRLDLDWSAVLPAVTGKVADDGYSAFGALFMMMLFSGILKSAAGPAPSYDMQKILATRRPSDAARLTGFVSVVLMPVRYLMIAGFAVLALVHVDRLDLVSGGTVDFENVLPAAIEAFAPVGVKGLILAGLLAAFMSTFASTLNAAPLYLVNDVYRRYIEPGASERRLVRMSYALAVIMVVVSTVIGLFVSSINDALQWIVSGLWGGYTASNVLKWYWWRFNGHGFFWGMITGIACALSFPLLFGPLFPQAGAILPLYLFPLILAVSGAAAVGVSLATPPDPAETLMRFYRQVRPWGFWGPVQRMVEAESPGFVANPNFGRDMFNVAVGTVVQTALVTVPVFMVVQRFEAMALSLLVVSVGVAILWRSWYCNLADTPEDEMALRRERLMREGGRAVPAAAE